MEVVGPLPFTERAKNRFEAARTSVFVPKVPVLLRFFFAEFGGNTFPPRAENILNNILSNISKLVFERLPKSDDEIKTRFDMIFPKRGLTAITR